MQLYLGERAVRRTHMWAHATAALASTMCKAMADVGDTEQRAAARSSLGLALDRAGCRASPGDWDLGHVVHRMEEKLRGSAVRDLGDALLLVLGLVECVAAESKDEAVRLPRDLDYRGIGGLSNEAREKLETARPETLGQAARIEGVTPGALTAVLAHVKRRDREAS